MVTRMSPALAAANCVSVHSGAVERPHPDPRAAFETEREKACRQRIDARGKLFPGPANVMAWRNQRLAIAPASGCLIEAAPDGVAEQRRVGGAADVAVEGVGQVGCSMCHFFSPSPRSCGERVGVRGCLRIGTCGSTAMTVSSRCSLRRALAAAGIEPGINAALKARKSFQRLGVEERQQLHQDHAGDVTGRVDPEIGVGEAGPGEAAGAAAFRRLGAC